MVVNRLKKHSYLLMFFMAFLIAGCIIADNYVDFPYSLKGESGSVFYYFFGSVILGGLFGVYLPPMLAVIPWYRNIKSNKTDHLHILSRIIKSGVTLSLGYIVLIIILLIIGLPLFIPRPDNYQLSSSPYYYNPTKGSASEK